MEQTVKENNVLVLGDSKMSREIETLNREESFKLVTEVLRGYGRNETRPSAVRNHAIVILMLDAGLRIGEVLKLKLHQVLYANEPVNTLVVENEKSKDHSVRNIPLTTRITAAIVQMDRIFWKPGGYGPDSFCFAKYSSGRPITARQIQRIVKFASKRAFGRTIHPHVLRHTFATRLIRKTSIPVVQRLLGHKSILTTQIYTHTNSDDLTEAIGKLNEI